MSSLAHDIEILYESSDYLFVNKPYDLLINSDDENETKTLHQILLSRKKTVCTTLGLKHGYHFVHRLDFATSGVICLSKNKPAAAVAGKLFECRLVDKFYLAIVRGEMKNEMITVDIPIGYDRRYMNENRKMCIESDDCLKPKKALTKILVLEKGLYFNETATKIMMKPLTGRRHQLRLHCHVLGHNIVGDFTYSNRSDTDPPRMFLHSYRLILPIREGTIDIITKDPFTHTNEECIGWSPSSVINTVPNAFEKLKTNESELTVIKETLFYDLVLFHFHLKNHQSFLFFHIITLYRTKLNLNLYQICDCRLSENYDTKNYKLSIDISNSFYGL